MNAVQRIQAILGSADAALADLAKDCMASRDYDGAAAAIDAARHLNFVGMGQDTPSPSTPEKAEAAPSSPITAAPTPTTSEPRRPSLSKGGRVKKGDYPKFVREDATLVKVGWSKSEKTEYEHKSPKQVVISLIPILTKVGANGKRFAMDKVLPLKDGDGGDFPDYQTYLCLAWLRTANLIVQHGRQGYTLPKGDLSAAVLAAWDKLPTR